MSELTCTRCGQTGHRASHCPWPVEAGPMRRGVATIDDLRVRSIVDAVTRCWHWQGAMSTGTPRIWAFDHAIGDKRAMSGSEAVWNIAHGESPKPMLVFRSCFCADCVNPVHHRKARNKAEIGLALRNAGVRKGTHVEQRRAAVLQAQIASGCVPTAPEIVRAVRAAPEIVSGRELAALFGLSQQTVSRMRRGESHRSVT